MDAERLPPQEFPRVLVMMWLVLIWQHKNRLGGHPAMLLGGLEAMQEAAVHLRPPRFLYPLGVR